MNKLMMIAVIAGMLVLTITGSSQDISYTGGSEYYVDSLYSESLGEFRKHNVYLPDSFDAQKNYPIIYATDGERSTDNSFIKAMLDSLISNEIIEPVIYIGSHSNDKVVGGATGQGEGGSTFAMQYRNFEYVDNDKHMADMPDLKDRFKDHMKYFTDELIPSVEETLNQDPGPENRIFYGFSNGAGFGANLLNRHPSLIGTYICYSTLGSGVADNEWSADIRFPDLYLKYGDQEAEVFRQEAEALVQKYEESGSFYEMEVFNGGHDDQIWNKKLPETLMKILD
ncbi:alpha/beta hydrolase [Balneola sp. MJW-20]|uniref:alpha/beta hydrolase n=1 Tax=Gracilimonas aurantiaca TaxID=3234185 RepID=UPI0034655007